MGRAVNIDAVNIDAVNTDAENPGAAPGSAAVDAVFWALVCADEEWLRTEFDGIVSEPAELRDTSPPRLTVATADNRERPWVAGHRAGAVRTAPWRHGVAPGRAWRRQRGPPRRRDDTETNQVGSSKPQTRYGRMVVAQQHDGLSAS